MAAVAGSERREDPANGEPELSMAESSAPLTDDQMRAQERW
jgi:hypothetical protein